MASAQLTCQIRVSKGTTNNADIARQQESAVFALKDCSDVGIETRIKWAHEVMKYFGGSHEIIRPWNLLARLDGSVESLTVPASGGEVYQQDSKYPPIFYVSLIAMKRSDEPRCPQWLVCSTRLCLAGSHLRGWPTTRCELDSVMVIFLTTLPLYRTRYSSVQVGVTSSRRS
jgi:hypothetical protein